MATTQVPDPQPVARGVKLKNVQKTVHRWLEMAQGDLDKASEMMDAEFYAGQVDAYKDVLWYLSVKPRVFRRANPRAGLYFSAVVAGATLITYNRKDTDA